LVSCRSWRYRDQLAGEVRFFFQHAEEPPPALEVGRIGIAGPAMAAALTTSPAPSPGAGGHAAIPHNTIDRLPSAIWRCSISSPATSIR
jgi:metal-dependent amidase/aminoacylase/carboxypeptidase family protein